jgi:hypothetical protein
MSRARFAMNVFTDSKVALRQAVTSPKQSAFFLGTPQSGPEGEGLKAELERQQAKEQVEKREKALSDKNVIRRQQGP